VFLFQNKTERHNRSAHNSSKLLRELLDRTRIKNPEFAEYSLFDEMSRNFLDIPSLSTIIFPKFFLKLTPPTLFLDITTHQ
jgi:hypothetical protein